jgi:hypothetical protein
MKNACFILSICLPFFFLSCGKNYSNSSTPVPVYGTYTSMNDVYKMLEVKTKVVTIDATTGGTFYGNSGTRYIIPPNALQDALGSPITGNVDIEVAEYQKKGDIIFSGVLPVSDGEPLISAGEININTTQTGQKVFLKPGKSFQANIPRNGDTLRDMQLFMGQPGSDPIKNKVNWKRRKIDSAHGPSYGIVYNGDTISIISDSFEFCNADRLGLSSWSYQEFTITITTPGATIQDSALTTFALYDNFKSLWRCGWYGAPVNGIYSEHHLPNLPMHFISYALINNKFYAGVTAATPVTGGNYTVVLTETDPASFKGQLNTAVK